jgi:hypothetical protein
VPLLTARRPSSPDSQSVPSRPSLSSRPASTSDPYPPSLLDRTRDAQVPYLAQHLLHPGVQHALGVLLPRVRVEILLDLGHARVRLGAEAQLDLDEGLERGVEVRHAQVDELRQLGEQLLVERLVRLLCELRLALGARQLRGVLVRLLDQFLDAGSRGVVVEQLVITLLDACRATVVSVDVVACRCVGTGRERRRGRGGGVLTFVDIGKVVAEAHDGV